MSEDDGEQRDGFLKRHRKEFWVGTLILSVIIAIVLLSVYGWIPGLAFLFSPTLLAFYGVVFFLAVVVAAVYHFSSSESMSWGGAAGTQNQLSDMDAKKLMQYRLYAGEDTPLIPAETKAVGTKKPRRDRNGEEETIRIYRWWFRDRNSVNEYCALMALDQEIEFDREWVERRTRDDIEKLQDAIHSIQGWERLERREQETAEEFEERIQEAVDDLGQAVKNDILEQLERQGFVKRQLELNPEGRGELPKQISTEQSEQED